jgi:ketosteroid isomerase-like protein
MKANSVSDLVLNCFAAYQSKDREAIEGLLSDDFTFTSPYDDHIGMAAYFERCWPNSDKMRAFRVMKLFEQGNDAFILYEAQFGSEVVRNTEFFRTEGDKIKAVEVYFGSPTKDAKGET